MHTINALEHFAQGYEFLAYVLLFLGVVIEGELSVIFAGILAQIGVLSMPIVMAVSFAGAVVKTVSWYYLGVFLHRKYSHTKFLTYIKDKVLYMLPRLIERPFWSIFLSKFIYGINHLTLILSGYLRINFNTYFKAEFYSSAIWVAVMSALGFFFSQAAIGYSRELHKFSLVVLLLIVGFIFLEKFIVFLFTLKKK